MSDKNCEYVRHEFYDLTRVAEPGDDYCYAPSRPEGTDEYGGTYWGL